MPSNTLLRLDRLRLSNFKCFVDCDVELENDINVIVAENAQGKTALLSAIAIALDVFVSTISKQKVSRKFEFHDIHLERSVVGPMTPAPSVSFVADGVVNDQAITWNRSRASIPKNSRSTNRETSSLRRAVSSLGEGAQNQSIGPRTTLPSVAFYGTSRLHNENKRLRFQHWNASSEQLRLAAYSDCLEPSASFRQFSEWYAFTASELKKPTSKSYSEGQKPELLLAAVRKAVATALVPTGWTQLDWEFPPQDEHKRDIGVGHLVVEHQERGRLPLAWLSDGVRNMVALVGDLAHRCARLNPHLGENAALETPGILLIDEVDMHLHPSWQQLVVELLEKAFPKMQKVYTTHSPQVLTTIESRCIRRLLPIDEGNWRTDEEFLETKGVESSSTLIEVMGVNQIPPIEEADWRNDYTAHIENGTHEDINGIRLREKLVKHYGSQHPIMMDFDRLIRFQAFKQRRQDAKE